MDESLYTDSARGGRWNEVLLRPLAEINEEAIEAIMAATQPLAAVRGMMPSLQDRWCALGALARRNLARCPFLLLDAGFAHAELWAALPRAAVQERRAGPERMTSQVQIPRNRASGGSSDREFSSECIRITSLTSS